MGKIYGSPAGTAKELTNVFFGDENGLAKAISQGYIGDENGIARKIFGTPPIPPITSPLYLIQDGKSVNTDVTGGWQARAVNTWGSSGGAVAPTLSWQESNTHVGTCLKVSVYYSNSKARSGIVDIINDIDLTYYNTIKTLGYCLVASTTTTSGWARLCVFNRSTNSIVRYIAYPQKITDIAEQNINISDLTGTYDICIAQKSGSSKGSTGHYNKIILES